MIENRRSFLAKFIALLLGGVASRSALSANGQTGTTVNLAVGDVYKRGDSAYESKRQASVWQALKPERYPDMIVQAHSEADIVSTVKYARANQLKVSVRGSGHSYVASPLRNGGILLDVSGLREVDIEPSTRQARIQPGIRSAEFSAMLERHGLGFPIAHCPTVSMGGYLLGGGMGWNGEGWGQLACTNVKAVDLVTAAGERIHANQDSHAELFWAVRGAGPAFCAVVTRYYLEVFPMPEAITSSTYVYGMDAIGSVIDWLEVYKAEQHPKIELTVIFATDDGAQSSDPRQDRQCIVSAVCFADSVEEATLLLGGIARDAPKKYCIHCAEYQPRTMQDLLAASKAVIPHRHAVDTLWTSDSSRVLHEIGKHFINTPSRDTHVFANYRATSTLKMDTAYSVIAPMFILSSSTWAASEDDAICLSWSDEMMEKLKPYNQGSYINETDFIRHPERARQCFTPDSLLRLKNVLERYDPTGMFSPPFEL